MTIEERMCMLAYLLLCAGAGCFMGVAYANVYFNVGIPSLWLMGWGLIVPAVLMLRKWGGYDPA